MTTAEMQEKIFSEIKDPANKYYVRVQRKELNRVQFLSDTKRRIMKEGIKEEDADDICLLVDQALWGFGILDALINADDSVSDIRLVDENNIRVKRNGVREETNLKFATEADYRQYIDHITTRNNTNMSVVNAAQVFTDKDSSPSNILRFSLVSPALNTNDRPTLLIRKIPKVKKTMDSLLAAGFLAPWQADYLKDRWRSGHGMLVCGPNGSGKTTLINALLESTDPGKSAVVIQESEELFCSSHPEMIFRKIVPRRSGSSVSYSLQDLGRLALMESFDIIVVGEIKGGEAADLAYATYTGSQPMTSVHSVSAQDGYEKIVDYALAEHPERDRGHFIKQLQAMDTIVFVKDYGVREILEVRGYDRKTEQYDFHAVTEADVRMEQEQPVTRAGYVPKVPGFLQTEGGTVNG